MGHPLSAMSAPVVIVGGGIVGLSSAYELLRRGRTVVLLEKGANPNARTKELMPVRPRMLTVTGTLAPGNVTVSSGTATTIASNGGDNQSGTVGTTVTTAPSVKVTDAQGNAVTAV